MFWAKLALAALLAAALLLLIRPGAQFAPPLIAPPSDPEAALAAREAGIDPELAARIIWAGAPGARTPLAIVYLHGFSASPEEIRPVPDDVAAALGANLLLARLSGHGAGGDAMGDAGLDDWAQDLSQAIAIGRALGERVAVIGTSTGGTLAALGASDETLGPQIDAVVMVSPNFRLKNRAAPLLSLPFARHWLPAIAGRERCFTPRTADHERFWTSCYPTRALIPMASLVRAARGKTGRGQPLLILADPGDRIVDSAAASEVAANWSGPASFTEITTEDGDDPDRHVIAGRILSPATTPEISRRITEFLRQTLAP
ncbi:MAG: alpha/beta fold hydrolase [Paracoccus sp. (in: a-proteobacteria)]|nr:alpha/beta fold hydrolase [Paracoccus sp. (in: a-proteobacteria)]